MRRHLKSNTPKSETSDDDTRQDTEAKSSFLAYYDLTVSLIKAVAWPLVVLFLFLWLHSPLTRTVEKLPNLISKSKKITVSGVGLEIDPSLAACAPDVYKALSGLSPDALKLLIKTGNAHQYENSNEPGFAATRKALVELKNAGLIELQEGKEVDKPEYGDIHYWATETGRKAYDFLNAVVINELKEP
jgi:hypothetical protein